MIIPFDRYGPELATFVFLPILALMFAISIKLYRLRKKKSYLSLSLALLLSLAAQIGGLVDPEAGPSWMPLAITGANMAGTVLMVLGLYQLHTVVSSFVKWLLYVLCAGAAALPFLVEPWIASSAITGFAVIVAVTLNGRIGADYKFPAAMAMIALTGCVQLLAVFFPSPAFGWSGYVEHWMPVLAYAVLFFVLFDRVTDIVQLSYLSSITDPLTGLFNRRYFNAYVGKYMAASVPVSVLFSDIDNFKKLNDTKGHKVGDDALKQVAAIMKSEADGVGIAGRYGGEEMVVYVTDPDVDMSEFAERIRARIEQETIVTASIGYSINNMRVTPEELVKQADAAMYQAKQTGKNKVVFHGDMS
ncbi:GGDEF domain-containing protein [Paenibacillus validus]|uniref:GGDEF domain-containing protein n=1 Tax=Paenibacillus validus TaxID=44253 RepID=UPI003D2AA854